MPSTRALLTAAVAASCTCGCAVTAQRDTGIGIADLEARVREGQKPYTPDCTSYDGLPTADEFEAITKENTPVVFRNAWLAFGPRVRKWGSRAYLLEKLGHLVNPTSLFDLDRAKDGGDRFSTRAIRSKKTGKYNLLLPYKEDWTIRQLIEYDWRGEDNPNQRGERRRVLAFAEQADSYNLDEFVSSPPPGEPCEDPVTVPELHADVALGAFLRDSYAELVHFNLWLGKIPDAKDGRHPGREAAGSEHAGPEGGGHEGAPPAKDQPAPGRFVKEATLHYDPNDNLLLMLSGTKTVNMYADADRENVYDQKMPQYDRQDPWDPEARLAKPRYEGDVISERNNFSPFNPLKPDFVNLPKARHARRKTCTLQPGDMLYMPALTWHQVISTPDEHELNIAANMWFYAKCGDTSPYTRVPMAVCGQFGDEVAGEDFRDEGGQYD